MYIILYKIFFKIFCECTFVLGTPLQTTRPKFRLGTTGAHFGHLLIKLLYNMKFGKSLSIPAFKEECDASELKVVKNPKNGNLFVTANGETVAAVSKNYDPNNSDKAFVELIKDDGERLWCLHNSTNANVEETL